ncbi:unnamed protein product [Ranitomeya imitator]|uniref:Fibrinogen C-terminal domain-containing protein n=1 Tax=Ranitomeya imitator TaxID=111125 RepID=A0ABN9LU50_9NEOB|nr:unnamed protein product [Ranitomeya imitator]
MEDRLVLGLETAEAVRDPRKGSVQAVTIQCSNHSEKSRGLRPGLGRTECAFYLFQEKPDGGMIEDGGPMGTRAAGGKGESLGREMLENAGRNQEMQMKMNCAASVLKPLSSSKVEQLSMNTESGTVCVNPETGTRNTEPEGTREPNEAKEKKVKYFETSFNAPHDPVCLGSCCLALAAPAAKNCKELRDQGIIFSGWYTIYPDGMQPLMVLCDMITDGGGWIVFQRRVDGSEDFYQDWETYKRGFGNQATEFWLGNENIHRLTSGGRDQVLVMVSLLPKTS